MLADAQAVAQKTALDWADRARQVNHRLDLCLEEVRQLRSAAEALVDAFEALVADDSQEHRLAVRAAMRALGQVV